MDIEQLKLLLSTVEHVGTTAAWFALAYHLVPTLLSTVGWLAAFAVLLRLVERLHKSFRTDARFTELMLLTEGLHHVRRGSMESQEEALSRVVAALAQQRTSPK